MTGEVPTVPSDTVLLAGTMLPLRVICTPIPCATDVEAVLLKIELAVSAVVPER